MTDEDRKAIREYMGWFGINHLDKIDGNFDLNDAALCVQKMQKRGDWRDFLVWQQFDTEPVEQLLYHIAYLYNADNFFKGFVEWRKGNEQG